MDINRGTDFGNSSDGDVEQTKSVQVQLLDVEIQTGLDMDMQIGLDLGSQLLDIEIDLGCDLGNNIMRILLETSLVGLGADLEHDTADMGINLGNNFHLQGSIDAGLDVGIDSGLGLDLEFLDFDFGLEEAAQDLGFGGETDVNVSADLSLERDTGINEDLGFGLDEEVDDDIDEVGGRGGAATTALEEFNGALVVIEGGEGLGGGGEEGEGHDGRNESADSHFWSWFGMRLEGFVVGFLDASSRG